MKVLATLPKVHSMKHVAELRDLYDKNRILKEYPKNLK